MIEIEKYRVRTEASGKMSEVDIDDAYYSDIVCSSNGGYFFKGSIHFFGSSSTRAYHDIYSMNRIMQNEYKDFLQDEKAIGEDVFGNLFLYSPKGIYSLNIESGTKEFLAKDFESLVKEIMADVDYFTGGVILDQMSTIQQNKLLDGFRFSGRKPFVIGGEYDMTNVILKSTIENLKFSAFIARQIKDIPDGQPIKITLSYPPQ